MEKIGQKDLSINKNEEKICFLLLTRARAYKARDEAGQNAVEQSKVDQNMCFLNLRLETPVRKVL